MVDATEPQQETEDRALFKYRYIVLALILFFGGVLLILVYARDAESEKNILSILCRDIGIALIPAGTILFANELLTHFRFERMISNKMHSVLASNKFLADTFTKAEAQRDGVKSDILTSITGQKSFLAEKFSHAEAQRDVIKSAIPSSITEQNALLSEKFKAVEGKLGQIFASIPFALRLRALGVSELYEGRPGTDRIEHMLSAADAGSEIYMLGIALTNLSDGRVQTEIEEKLAQGCKLKLLWLDPESPHVRQRAVDERRSYDELHTDLSTQNTHLVNFVEGRLAKYRKSIEYGRYSSPPPYFIFMTSITMIVGFYLPGRRGFSFPHMELSRKEGGIYDAFKGHFTSLWDVTKAQEADAQSGPQ
ncbi:MAG TPA: hypothetical protein VM914_02390 [Pyrinomonadaceae bacterium]|nr:hypothetical protein [Pyrinomonadaceae bacterium]